MLYTICILAILVASVCLILAILVQSPKSGMAANFGAANQVMGVRESANFLERFTWTMAIAIVVLSLVATLSMDRSGVAESNRALMEDANALLEGSTESSVMPQATLPESTEAQPAEAAETQPAAEAAQPAADAQ